MPARFSRSRSALYTRIISSSLRLFMGLTSMAFNFHHNHDVLVASLRTHGVLACLTGEHGFVYHVCFGVDVAHFLTPELGGVASLQRRCFGFGGAHVLSCLILMTFCCFDCLGVVLLDVAFI
jgi:hypothetical protein